MKKIKRHKIKTEKPETSAFSRSHEEHDLAYYIHDRVELMHQVFSVLKYKELKAMAPECVRNLAVGDLQELCTEELLGISSKRLLAILDGAEPPSDTESSSPSPDRMETISLDSISSDEEILSQASKKKKHKHHRSKSKSKRRKQKEASPEEGGDLSKASRAGLTVLELLELQARARAIRAQLQNEQAKKQVENPASESRHSSDNEVEIKEEAPDVVEISSEDEKPDIATLQAATAQKSSPSKPNEPETTTKETASLDKPIATRRVSDLIIMVPQTKTSKIKLNRSKVTVTVPNASNNDNSERITVTEKVDDPKTADKSPKTNVKQTDKSNKRVTVTEKVDDLITADKSPKKNVKQSDKSIKKQKKNKKKKNTEKEGSDHDEITLQLSDSEKMDLLEDLNEKNYDKLSSSADSESSSSDSDDTTHLPAQSEIITTKRDSNEDESNIDKENQSLKADEHDPNDYDLNTKGEITASEISKDAPDKQHIDTENEHKTTENLVEKDDDKVVFSASITNSPQPLQATESRITTECSDDKIDTSVNNTEQNDKLIQNDDNIEKEPRNEIELERAIELSTIVDIPVISEKPQNNDNERETIGKEIEEEKSDLNKEKTGWNKEKDDSNKVIGDLMEEKPDINKAKADLNIEKVIKKDVSEGELSDRASSEVEACEIEPVVVCISDDEKQKSNKKKKKKDKKTKKEKKSKKSKQDFREGADQNFYKNAEKLPVVDIPTLPIDTDNNKKAIDITDDDEDVYEILELSDDSSCYEVEGTVLSKEPTAEEIEALSARIDEIKREDIESKHAYEIDNFHTKSDDSGPETWKDRYLDSKKVKRVLTTANILNALRKKNKELKRKIEKSKIIDNVEIVKTALEENLLEEGSIGHYQTLQGSTKYVDPVQEAEVSEDVGTEESKGEDKTISEGKGVTLQMKKDAKQLLKMYKKLLKYNDMTKQRDPNKKKKRKKKNHNGGDVASGSVNSA